MKKTAATGDHVTVHYEGVMENGEIFESTTDSGPLEFRIGDHCVLPAFEQAVTGMKTDETKTVTLQPEEAYGPRREELTHTIKRQTLGTEFSPKAGMLLGLTVTKNGEQHKVPALVTAVREEEVDVDFNHPLAGKTLIYKITLKTLTPGPGEEEPSP